MMKQTLVPSLIICSLQALFLAGCVNAQTNATPSGISSIVGTWRFTQAGEHKIDLPFLFLMEFRSDGTCNSGPTPTGLMQRATYTYDGKTIVITNPHDSVTIKNVHVDGNTMTMLSEDGGKPMVLTYQRVWPP